MARKLTSMEQKNKMDDTGSIFYEGLIFLRTPVASIAEAVKRYANGQTSGCAIVRADEETGWWNVYLDESIIVPLKRLQITAYAKGVMDGWYERGRDG